MHPPRVDFERSRGVLAAPPEPVPNEYSVPDVEPPQPLLPRDHPAWMRDAVALSGHARRWIERLRPAVIRVLTFWDHTVRSALVAGRQISVDGAGCYRID
jgi:hypothetical protein